MQSTVQTPPPPPDPPLADPLILTLRLDPENAARFEALRRQYFPPALNRVPAHVTLFHHLPGDRHADVAASVAAVCSTTPRFPVRVTAVMPLGKGVAYRLDAPELSAGHAQLRATWLPHLTRQDLQPYRPHLVVQNKTTPADARATLDTLSRSFTPTTATAEGLLLWWYRGHRGGTWDPAGDFAFTA